MGGTSRDLADLLDHLSEELDGLTERVLESFRAEILAYAAVPDADLRPGVRSNVERALDALRRGGSPTQPELAAAQELGAMRAQQGIPLEALLQAHRIGVREAIAEVREEAARRGASAEEVLDLATRAWDWIDAVMLRAARGHREQEIDLASAAEQRRAQLLRGLLHGLLEEAGLQSTAVSHGILPDASYSPVCAFGSAASLRQLDRALHDAARQANVNLVAAPLDEGLAAVVAEMPQEDVGRLVGAALAATDPELVAVVGVPSRPAELEPSYRFARRALEAARGIGQRGLVGLDEVSLHAAILAQPDVTALLLERYVAPLEREGDFGRELIATLEAWFAHGMRTEETAAALPVHPNTLRHRLRRVEELAGVSLGTTVPRFELWWALTARRIRRPS